MLAGLIFFNLGDGLHRSDDRQFVSLFYQNKYQFVMIEVATLRYWSRVVRVDWTYYGTYLLT